MRKLIRWGWVTVAIAALYAAFVFWKRKSEADEIAARKAAMNAEINRRILRGAGGTGLKISTFYATPSVKKGDTAKLCYGVLDAAKVKLEPAIEMVWPALNRCIEFKPQATATYKLTAEDASGKQVERTLTIEVR
ncbi:MAG: hypothetical protein JNL98_14835 [Bryobacterales bacterium]|nr:hypothetical protein [Bryobacterales bacterium]